MTDGSTMVDHCIVWQCAGHLQDWVEATPAHVAPDSRPASLVGQFAMPAKCLLCMETLEMQDRPQGRHKILCCLDGKGMKRLVFDSSSLFLLLEVRQAALALKPGLVCVACGSYRRGKPTCGDVDVLVTHPDGQSHRGVFSKLLDSLHRSGKRTGGWHMVFKAVLSMAKPRRQCGEWHSLKGR